MAGRVGEILPEVLSSVACNCKRLNMINYIFEQKDFTGGEEAELEPGPSCGGGWGPSQSFGRKGCWV